MKIQAALALALMSLSGFASSQENLDYSDPVTMTVSAKCAAGPDSKEQWFALLSKLGMKPRAEVNVSVDSNLSVTSTDLVYFGSMSNVVSASVHASAQRQVELLAARTHCKASFHAHQNMSGS